MAHSGGLVDVVLELGFDEVKYFEGDITGTASGFTITPPARRLQLVNKSSSVDIYFKVNDGDATTAVSFVPGDNIKLGAGCTFTMDYDAVSQLSFITEGSSAAIEGLLGWKGSNAC
jgi:hypothetical protein